MKLRYVCITNFSKKDIKTFKSIQTFKNVKGKIVFHRDIAKDMFYYAQSDMNSTFNNKIDNR